MGHILKYKAHISKYVRPFFGRLKSACGEAFGRCLYVVVAFNISCPVACRNVNYPRGAGIACLFCLAMPHYVRVACLCRLTLPQDKGLGLWGVDCGEYERVYMVAENGFPSALKEAHGCVLNGLQYIFQNAGYKKPEKGIAFAHFF